MMITETGKRVKNSLPVPDHNEKESLIMKTFRTRTVSLLLILTMALAFCALVACSGNEKTKAASQPSSLPADTESVGDALPEVPELETDLMTEQAAEEVSEEIAELEGSDASAP